MVQRLAALRALEAELDALYEAAAADAFAAEELGAVAHTRTPVRWACYQRLRW